MRRWLKAFIYSWQGFKQAYAAETAFREECWGLLVLTPLAWWLAESWLQFAALVGGVLLLMIVELLNSALEALCDHLWPEHNPIAKQVKDYGSAAVLLALCIAALIWIAVAASNF